MTLGKNQPIRCGGTARNEFHSVGKEAILGGEILGGPNDQNTKS